MIHPSMVRLKNSVSNEKSCDCNANTYFVRQDSEYERRHYRSVSNSPDHFGDERVSPIPSPMPARLPPIPVKRGYRSATNSLEENPSRSPTPEHLPPASRNHGLVSNAFMQRHAIIERIYFEMKLIS